MSPKDALAPLPPSEGALRGARLVDNHTARRSWSLLSGGTYAELQPSPLNLPPHCDSAQKRVLSSDAIVRRVVKWSWWFWCPVSQHGPQSLFPKPQGAALEVPSNLEAQGGRRGWRWWQIHLRKADHGTRVELLLMDFKDAALCKPTAQVRDARISALTSWCWGKMIPTACSKALWLSCSSHWPGKAALLHLEGPD